MFVDEVIIRARAGRGGDGVVRWLHEKGKEFSGPAGGDGGRGGDVYLRGVRDIGALARYRSAKSFSAGDGEPGGIRSRHGANGSDLVLVVPVGSVVTNLATGRSVEILREGETAKVLSGGAGGYGNEHFKSSVNVAPREWTPGKKGEEADFRIELRLIIDGGFIGLPNAGKSSLLNALTNARAKVASYPFTTLEPNLGDFFGYVLADIPGLIEGAAEGKGLGHTFLRHVRRTKMLLHCLSLEHDDLERPYRLIREEIRKYDAALAEKPELLILTKSDVAPNPAALERKLAAAEKLNPNRIAVSVLDDDALKGLGERLATLLRRASS